MKSNYEKELTQEDINLLVQCLLNGVQYGLKVNLGGDAEPIETLTGVELDTYEFRGAGIAGKIRGMANAFLPLFMMNEGIYHFSEYGTVHVEGSSYPYEIIRSWETEEEEPDEDGELWDVTHYHNSIVKPYLRPLSSMTKEEMEEYKELTDVSKYNFVYPAFINKINDFHNSHHLDYNFLIDKGLAIEALEGMYNIKD